MPVIIAEIDLIKYVMPLYENKKLSDKNLFRSVVLYSRNVASYKFALAESLLHLGKEGKNIITLDELAVPFSTALLRHLEESVSTKQISTI